MPYVISTVDNRIRVMLSGNINAAKAASIAKTLSNYLTNSPQLGTVDFSKVDSIDSAGFGVFFNMQNIVRRHGGSVVLSGLSGIVIEEPHISADRSHEYEQVSG